MKHWTLDDAPARSLLRKLPMAPAAAALAALAAGAMVAPPGAGYRRSVVLRGVPPQLRPACEAAGFEAELDASTWSFACDDDPVYVYVATDGDDAAAGTRAAPVRTIEEATRRVRARPSAPSSNIMLVGPGVFEVDSDRQRGIDIGVGAAVVGRADGDVAITLPRSTAQQFTIEVPQLPRDFRPPGANRNARRGLTEDRARSMRNDRGSRGVRRCR